MNCSLDYLNCQQSNFTTRADIQQLIDIKMLHYTNTNLTLCYITIFLSSDVATPYEQ
jgi:hypothetical protein